MKKILTIIAVATMFAACSNDELDTQKDVVITDTSGMYKSNYSTDVPEMKEEEAPVAPTKVIRETRVVYVDRTPKAKKQTIREANPVITQPQPQVEENTTGTTASTQPNTGTQTTGNDNTGAGTTAPETKTEEKEEKKGWSNAAKKATIGGAGGAVLGAIISKKKVKGAIIGGVIGAAGGYILGRKQDKAQEAKDNVPQYTSY